MDTVHKGDNCDDNDDDNNNNNNDNNNNNNNNMCNVTCTFIQVITHNFSEYEIASLSYRYFVWFVRLVTTVLVYQQYR